MLILWIEWDKIMLALLAFNTVNLWNLNIERNELFRKLARLWIYIRNILIFLVRRFWIIYYQNSLFLCILVSLWKQLLIFLIISIFFNLISYFLWILIWSLMWHLIFIISRILFYIYYLNFCSIFNQLFS